MSICKNCSDLIADDEFICKDCVIDLCQSHYAVKYIAKYFDVFKEYILSNMDGYEYTIESLVEGFCFEDSKNWIEFLWLELNDE